MVTQMSKEHTGNNHVKIYVDYSDAQIGKEIYSDNNIWVVRAKLREHIYDGGIQYQVLCEFVETRLNRLERLCVEMGTAIIDLGNSNKQLTNILNGKVIIRRREDHGPADFFTIANEHKCGSCKPSSPDNTYYTVMDDDTYMDLRDGKIKRGTPADVNVYLNFQGIINDVPHYIFHASCPSCGSLLYIADHPSTFKEVFPVEKPYCYHCGIKVNSSNVEVDESKYDMPHDPSSTEEKK